MPRLAWITAAVVLAALLALHACGDQEEVVVSTIPVDTESALMHIVRMNCNLLAQPLPNPEVEDVRVDPEDPDQAVVTVINTGPTGEIIVELQTIAQQEHVAGEVKIEADLQGGATQVLAADLVLPPKAHYRANIVSQDPGVLAEVINVHPHPVDPSRAVIKVENRGGPGRVRISVEAVVVDEKIVREQQEKLELPEGARHRVHFETRLPQPGRFNASARPRRTPRVLGMLQEGDAVNIIEKRYAWLHVKHLKSGKTGWVNESFVQAEQRSPWYSGDTETARQIARKIYLDKNIVKNDWPIKHVNIEERFHRLAFIVEDDAEFPKEQAKECGLYFIEVLNREFPRWPNRQVFLTAKDKGEEYTMVVDEDGNVIFM
jgi:hypothetical protein